MSEDTQAFVGRIRRGDQAGLEGLMDRYEARLLRLAAASLGNRADAAEAVQDAFVSAWLGIGGYRDGSDLEAWLVTICLNACRMRLRRRTTEREGLRSLSVPGRASFRRP